MQVTMEYNPQYPNIFDKNVIGKRKYSWLKYTIIEKFSSAFFSVYILQKKIL